MLFHRCIWGTNRILIVIYSIHMNKVQPLSQDNRPASSLPMNDADLSLNNSNWTKGLQAMSDWIWSANLNPVAFANNLGKYFLHIPGVYEQQLNFSTSLIFDEPSFKNGVQISGFVNRIHKELAISMIAHTRRAWYTMTHHALLGKLTADKLGMSPEAFADKLFYLTEYDSHPEVYSGLELKILEFAHAFATNPKSFTAEQVDELKEEFRRYNKEYYQEIDLWLLKKEAANLAKAKAMSQNIKLTDEDFKKILDQYLDKLPSAIPSDLNERKVNAQIVELSFLCLQFVALACVFSGLNIPDESFFAGVMMDQVPPKVIEKINELNELGLEGNTPELTPPPIDDMDVLLEAVIKDQLVVEPALLKGARIPLVPYEGRDSNGELKPAFSGAPDRDKGITVGGIQTGVYGWSLGGHFPGSLPYCLMNHPELSRFETQYSLPLLFNEDEWRNGIHTSGYISRKIKEILIQKIYKTNRSRYGIEHHTMYLYNAVLDESGTGRITNPDFNQQETEAIRANALKLAEAIVLHVHDHRNAPAGTFTPLEDELLSWADELLKKPHKAWQKEERVRTALKESNRVEIQAGLRVLDTSPGIGTEAALNRLADHQIAEMAMLIGHMDGLGRLLTILRLEVEGAVQVVEGKFTAQGGIKPELDENGQVRFTGYFNNRDSMFAVLNSIGVSTRVQTMNELFVNPALCKNLAERLKAEPNRKIKVKSISEGSAEF